MKPHWKDNLILICEKCGKKLADRSGGNPAVEMKDWLKKEMKSRSLWGTSRVVTTGCLDICPEGKIAVAFVSDRPDLPAHAEIVGPKDRDRILQTAVARARTELE